jgi:Tol biopolymer transport system component
LQTKNLTRSSIAVVQVVRAVSEYSVDPAWSPDGKYLVYSGADKNFWLLNPQTGAERQLTELPSKFAIGDFDVAPDGTEIIFDRLQDSSSIALFERTR